MESEVLGLGFLRYHCELCFVVVFENSVQSLLVIMANFGVDLGLKNFKFNLTQTKKCYNVGNF